MDKIDVVVDNEKEKKLEVQSLDCLVEDARPTRRKPSPLFIAIGVVMLLFVLYFVFLKNNTS